MGDGLRIVVPVFICKESVLGGITLLYSYVKRCIIILLIGINAVLIDILSIMYKHIGYIKEMLYYVGQWTIAKQINIDLMVG